jgi:FixJ family two-component response regulator
MITVVDGDPSVRKALSRLIGASGYESAVYESAEAFLDADVADETECLVLDVHLPGMSGLDLQAELANTGVKFPIVFITAFDEERPRTQALAAGATEFLCKPLDSDRLIAAIQKAMMDRGEP